MALSLSRAAVARAIPFAAFSLMQALRGMWPEDGSGGFDPRWLDGATLLLVAATLAWFWREYGELVRQTLPSVNEAALAVGVGVLVFVLWIKLDGVRIGGPNAGFVPTDTEGRLIWPLVVLHGVVTALLVPLMNELFWRSFLMRWLHSPQFEAVVPQRVGAKAIVLATFVFTLAHTLWLAASLAGIAYALLYVRTGKLWVPVIAHAVTNVALGVWVIQTQRWGLW